MNGYSDFLAMLSSEFQKYLMENEEMADKIPSNAHVIVFVCEYDAEALTGSAA